SFLIRIGENQGTHDGHAGLRGLVHVGTRVRNEIVVQRGILPCDVDDFAIVVVPKRPLRSENDLHHRTECAELEPAGEQILVLTGGSKITAGIRSPHWKVDQTRADSGLYRYLQSFE